MILTEEQRGALTRAIDYINETDLPVGELDGFDREVLRNMVTTAINYGPDVMKMIELLAAGEHDQWADWAQSILDSEPGLSDGRKAAWPEMIATPYENLSEELKDKDRREVHLRSSVALDYIQQQSAEIERLRADLEQAEICIQARLDVIDQQAARIQELGGMLSIRTEELEIAHSCARSEREMHEKELVVFARKIPELEEALAEERAKYNLSWKDCAYRAPDTYCEKTHNYCTSEDCPLLDEQKTEARRQLRAEGKIDSSEHVTEPTKMIGFDLEVRWHDDYMKRFSDITTWHCGHAALWIMHSSGKQEWIPLAAVRRISSVEASQ
jgi:hypothetical protein